jgi:hypothetical protein
LIIGSLGEDMRMQIRMHIIEDSISSYHVDTDTSTIRSCNATNAKNYTAYTKNPWEPPPLKARAAV